MLFFITFIWPCIATNFFVIKPDVDWIRVRDLAVPMHLGLYIRALCAPNRNHESPVALPKPQMAPRPMLLISPVSKKKKKVPRCVWMWGPGLTFTQNMSRGLLLHTTPPTHGAVSQPYQEEIPSQGVVSGKETSYHPGRNKTN
jgi:hypothetical protein